MEEIYEIVRRALNEEYKHLMPEGFTIYRIAEYDPKKHSAPHLAMEKKANPLCRYIVILTSDNASGSALGETVNDAVKAAILKFENLRGRNG